VKVALPSLSTLLMTRIPLGPDVVGALVVGNRREGRPFTRSHAETSELIAAHAAALLEVARLQEQRRYHASLDERRRIAAELHDGLIQTLASLDIRTLNCTQMWRNHDWEPLGEELLLIKMIAEEALRDARGAINQLAPARLREEGLEAYLQDAIERFRRSTSMPLEASIELGDAQVPEPTALLLIGLLREGLNNIRKHAQAGQVVLTIRSSDGEILFRLADDGVGLRPGEDPFQRSSTGHYGLAYLRARITTVGGTLRLTGRPGVGTVLEARVPLLTEERLMALLASAPP
jgi:two-component system sensor histidine kinase UhpB